MLSFYGWQDLQTPLSYRPDIDGLRALAVVAVILFHLGVTPISGGFVGVDVFFVISGYLITSIITKDIRANNFSLARFYKRRILRIFPALFLVMACSTIAGYFLLFPPDFLYFGQSLAAAAGFGSNILFWQKSGYFEADSFLLPLLHTWSLAVEEQFYIVFPLFLILTYKIIPRYLLHSVIITMLVSLGLALAAERMETYAILFYLLPTRAWELMAGAFLALSVLPRPQNRFAIQALSLAGLLLILYPVFFFDKETIFPGSHALYPVFGAALVIYCGFDSRSFSYRALSQRIPVLLGRMSYSLYLWHWPLIVFVKYAMPVELNAGLSAVLLVLCAGLSFLSWRYVEQPLRHQSIISTRAVFTIAAIATCFFIVLGLVISKKEGIPDRFPKDIGKLYTARVGAELPLMTDGPAGSFNQMLGGSEEKPSFIVWGDSHAQAAAPGIDLMAKELGRKGYLMGMRSCIPSANDLSLVTEACNNMNRNVLEFINQHREIRTIVLVGHWSMNEIRFTKAYRLHKASSPTLFEDTLSQLIETLRKDGRKIIFMTEMPHTPVSNVPLYLARAEYYDLPIANSYDLGIQNKREKDLARILENLQKKENFKIVEPRKMFCPQGRCPLSHDGQALFSDDNHITAYGSKYYHAMYRALFE